MTAAAAAPAKIAKVDNWPMPWKMKPDIATLNEAAIVDSVTTAPAERVSA